MTNKEESLISIPHFSDLHRDARVMFDQTAQSALQLYSLPELSNAKNVFICIINHFGVIWIILKPL